MRFSADIISEFCGKLGLFSEFAEALAAEKITTWIAVINLWSNRLIDDATKPDESNRDDNGIQQTWPDWVLSSGSSPSGRRSFVTIPPWKPDEKRVSSGLLGPVILRYSTIQPHP